jgi:hypothetical protein
MTPEELNLDEIRKRHDQGECIYDSDHFVHKDRGILLARVDELTELLTKVLRKGYSGLRPEFANQIRKTLGFKEEHL